MDHLYIFKAKETKHRSQIIIAHVISNGFSFAKQFIGSDAPTLSHKVYSEVMQRECPEIRAILIEISHKEIERIKRGFYKV